MNRICKINLAMSALFLSFCAVPALSQYSGTLPTPHMIGVQAAIMPAQIKPIAVPAQIKPTVVPAQIKATVVPAQIKPTVVPAQIKPTVVPVAGRTNVTADAPILQGATCGTIGPMEGASAEIVTGVATPANQREKSESNSSSAAAPVLQGETNGTIGPMGADATYITGVCTAGTVRVNNLANLEALLNAITNLFQLGCAGAAVCMGIQAFLGKGTTAQDHGTALFNKLSLALAFSLTAIFADDAMSYLIASARDANLFS